MSATTILSSAPSRPAVAKKAVIHRMVMPHHTCPYGLKAKDLLERSGYAVEDHHLTTREQTDAFKAEHGVATTPQVFIGTVGAVSVFKAVYIDRRELKCACVGGSSNVPLGFISLTENLMMVAMAVWMALAASGLPVGAGHAI